MRNVAANPLYEAKIFLIQRGISQLQDKIRLINQINLQGSFLDRLPNSQDIYRKQIQFLRIQRANQYANNDLMLQRTDFNPYVNSFRHESAQQDPSKMNIYQLKVAIKQEADRLEYLKRLEKINQQNLAMESTIYSQNPYNELSRSQYPHVQRQFLTNRTPLEQFQAVKTSANRSRVEYDNSYLRGIPFKQQHYNEYQQDEPISEDSSALLQKYNRGIKAQQYNRDMEKLFQIQKRMKKAYQLQANESIVTKYQQQYQNSLLSSTKRKNVDQSYPNKPIRKDQKTVSFNMGNNADQLAKKILQAQKIDLFGYPKINQTVNKQKQEEKLRVASTCDISYRGKLANSGKSDASAVRTCKIYQSEHMRRPQTADRDNSTNSRLKSTGITGRRVQQQPYKVSNKKPTRSRIQSISLNKSLVSNRDQMRSLVSNRGQMRSLVSNRSQINYAAKKAESIFSPQQLFDMPKEVSEHFQRKNFIKTLQRTVNQKIKARLDLINTNFKTLKTNQITQERVLKQRYVIECRMKGQLVTHISHDRRVLKKFPMIFE